MAELELAKDQDAKADMIAAVLSHLLPDLSDYSVLDAFLAVVEDKGDRQTIQAGWNRAQIRRELAQRGLVLSDYSLRGL